MKITIEDLEKAWIEFLRRNRTTMVYSTMPSLILLSRDEYARIKFRVKVGEDVRLPVTDLQFRLDENEQLYLKWPVDVE